MWNNDIEHGNRLLLNLTLCDTPFPSWSKSVTIFTTPMLTTDTYIFSNLSGLGAWSDLGLFLLAPSPSGPSPSPAEGSLTSTSHLPSPLCSHCCQHLQLGIPESLIVHPTHALRLCLLLTALPRAQLWLHGCTRCLPWMPSAYFPLCLSSYHCYLLSFFLFKSQHFFRVWWKLAFSVVPASENKQVTCFLTIPAFSVAKLPATP